MNFRMYITHKIPNPNTWNYFSWKKLWLISRYLEHRVHNFWNDLLSGALSRALARWKQNTLHRYFVFSTFSLRINEEEQHLRKKYCKQTRLAQNYSRYTRETRWGWFKFCHWSICCIIYQQTSKKYSENRLLNGVLAHRSDYFRING